MASSEKVRERERERKREGEREREREVQMRSKLRYFVSLAASSARQFSELSHSPSANHSPPPTWRGRGCWRSCDQEWRKDEKSVYRRSSEEVWRHLSAHVQGEQENAGYCVKHGVSSKFTSIYYLWHMYMYICIPPSPDDSCYVNH